MYVKVYPIKVNVLLIVLLKLLNAVSIDGKHIKNKEVEITEISWEKRGKGRRLEGMTKAGDLRRDKNIDGEEGAE